ncbi:Precorrin-6A reductase [Pseudovibrio sp. W64]|uniref:precorrin-6A/cobalt-precorrin-6A reductase n=1 Tax=Pseudovibrio sp. W64 TaxID=1735583 RepID=UPI0007AE6B8F|nr:precorrin-6A/cobalt-precorrin-6A reductase [Pseudovibrio sp. W64]KZK77895.1 Precorrin-6A reductase [Pseudovibrio sp. W64]
MPEKPKILVLAGTREARKLIAALAVNAEFKVIASLAGVTKNPADLAVMTRTGGFGGVDGLSNYLQTQGIAAVIDATHPYATQISCNAAKATRHLAIPLLRFERAAWEQANDDIWYSADNVEAALNLIPPRAKVFFAASAKIAAPLKQRPDLTFVIRTLNRPSGSEVLQNAEYIEGLPNESWSEESELFKVRQVDWLISKNSGGSASYGKIRAARELQMPVAMLKRPKPSDGILCASIDEVLKTLKACVKNTQHCQANL